MTSHTTVTDIVYILYTYTTDPKALMKFKQGPAFINADDVIVGRSFAKTFITASENAICGAHQKGKVFKLHKLALLREIFLIYDEQKCRQPDSPLEQSSFTTKEEYH